MRAMISYKPIRSGKQTNKQTTLLILREITQPEPRVLLRHAALVQPAWDTGSHQSLSVRCAVCLLEHPRRENNNGNSNPISKRSYDQVTVYEHSFLHLQLLIFVSPGQVSSVSSCTCQLTRIRA